MPQCPYRREHAMNVLGRNSYCTRGCRGFECKWRTERRAVSYPGPQAEFFARSTGKLRYTPLPCEACNGTGEEDIRGYKAPCDACGGTGRKDTQLYRCPWDNWKPGRDTA